ncbi:MAG: RNA-guided endonuclease InsQ/TnpB family protein [Candidatus Thorarchaeota archaeon]
MKRSKGMVISVKVPIYWEMMTDRQKTRLSRITSRDTRVIKAFLGVIERHESKLLFDKNTNRIDIAKLSELTLTATRGSANRPTVEHDFKDRFKNISVNELHGCRDTAVAMWESYLALGGRKPLQSKRYASKKLPRYIYRNCFNIVSTPQLQTKHWLSVRDALDSVRQGRRIHDSLMIPLSTSSYHLNKLESGDAKSVRILKDRNQKWWAIFSVTLPEVKSNTASLPTAVIGIDLGVRKAVCSVLLTSAGLKDVRYWTQKEKVQQIEHYDSIVSSLQRKRDTLLQDNQSAYGVKKKLNTIGNKRARISNDHDRKLVKLLNSYIVEQSKSYDLYIAIGRVKGIRSIARKGNFRGRQYRGMIHRWSFYRITESLKHKLGIQGIPKNRVIAVPESWTSIKCHKCGHKGYRPKQSYFLCHTCGYRDNADKNAAINISRRLIMLIPSLKNENTGLGRWLLPKEKARPKTRRSNSSKWMSSLPERSPTSSEGESVADCSDQTTLELSGSSTDPAMVTTVETPSVAEKRGNLGKTKQWTEAQSRERSNAPMISGKGHVTEMESIPNLAGDSGHDKRGTQKSKVKGASSLYNITSEGLRSGSQVIGFPKIIPEDVDEQVGSRNKVSNHTKTDQNIKQSLTMLMSSASKSSLDSIVGSTVADCSDQTTLEEFVSSADHAMEKTIETPSAIMEPSDHDSRVQRTEVASVERSHAPMRHSKPRAHPAGAVLLVAGDSSQEED